VVSRSFVVDSVCYLYSCNGLHHASLGATVCACLCGLAAAARRCRVFVPGTPSSTVAV
jgi:hypothetical protein